MAAPSSLKAGSLVGGRWRIDRRIGRGMMATVFAATDRNGAKAAIKILHPDIARETRLRERFLREGYVGTSIEHPAIVRIFEDGVTDDDCPFLVMELLHGQTLETRRAATGKLPVDEVVDILLQLLDVLDAAHRKNIVHRDIKPENLVLEADGTLRVLDFGLARVLDGASEVSTRTGAILGTPHFMSPEQAAGQTHAVDHKTDVWAAGATAYLLLAGQHVHGGRGVTEILKSILTSTPRPLAVVAPDVPAEVATIIDGALVRAKDQRFTARAMRSALLAARRPRSEPDEDTAAYVRPAVAAPPPDPRPAAPPPMPDQPGTLALEMAPRPAPLPHPPPPPAFQRALDAPAPQPPASAAYPRAFLPAEPFLATPAPAEDAHSGLRKLAVAVGVCAVIALLVLGLVIALK